MSYVTDYELKTYSRSHNKMTVHQEILTFISAFNHSFFSNIDTLSRKIFFKLSSTPLGAVVGQKVVLITRAVVEVMYCLYRCTETEARR